MDKDSICTFTFREKIFCQFTFNAGVLVAAYGLFLNAYWLGLVYLLYSYIGIFLLLRYTICPRCPHLFKANDCVNLSAPVMKMIVSSKRKGPLNRYEKIIFVLVLYGVFILPIYWIASKSIILITFLILYGSHLLALHVHFCPNCSNKICMQNKSKQ